VNPTGPTDISGDNGEDVTLLTGDQAAFSVATTTTTVTTTSNAPFTTASTTTVLRNTSAAALDTAVPPDIFEPPSPQETTIPSYQQDQTEVKDRFDERLAVLPP